MSKQSSPSMVSVAQATCQQEPASKLRRHKGNGRGGVKVLSVGRGG